MDKNYLYRKVKLCCSEPGESPLTVISTWKDPFSWSWTWSTPPQRVSVGPGTWTTPLDTSPWPVKPHQMKPDWISFSQLCDHKRCRKRNSFSSSFSVKRMVNFSSECLDIPLATAPSLRIVHPVKRKENVNSTERARTEDKIKSSLKTSWYT